VSQENVEVVRTAYEGWNAGEGFDPELLTPDFELVQASSIIDSAGIFRGRNAVREVMEELQAAFEELDFIPEAIVDAGDDHVLVLVRAHGRGRASGMTMDNHIAHLWTFRDGKAMRLVVYEEQSEALKAVGLEE
jgi:ketosteroid isomerase-like protein